MFLVYFSSGRIVKKIDVPNSYFSIVLILLQNKFLKQKITENNNIKSISQSVKPFAQYKKVMNSCNFFSSSLSFKGSYRN